MADGEVGRVSLGVDMDPASLGKQINEIAKMAGDRLADVMKTSMSGLGKGMKEVTVPAPKVDKVDFASTQAEIEQLTAVLDNTNARIEHQAQKLAGLKRMYNETFNEADKNKLQGQILNTEATLLRMTRQSDSTAEKIWKLEDRLHNTRIAAHQVAKPIATIGQKMKKTNPQLTKSDKTLKDVAKSAGLAGVAMSTLGKKTAGMSNQFTKGFKRIAKQVLVFAVIYKAIRGLQSYIGSSLKTNSEYAKSLEQIKMNMKTAFTPIFQAALPAINALIKALVTATTYIATFTSALFGKTYKQSLQAAKGLDAARKSMDAYGKSAKKLGQTAGFDELNLLDTSTDDGGFATDLAAFEAPDLDIDKIQVDVDRLISFTVDSFNGMWERLKVGGKGLSESLMPTFIGIGEQLKPVLEGWKESFQALFTDIISLGEPFENWVFTGLIPAWQSGVELLGEVVVGLMESLLEVFNTYREAMMPIWESYITDGLPIVTDFIMQTIDLYRQLFDTVKTIFDDLWQAVIDPAMKLISGIIVDTLEVIYDFWRDWGGRIFDGLIDTLEGIKSLWSDLFDVFLKPYIEYMLDLISDLWSNHLKGMIAEVLDFVGVLIKAVLDILNKFVLPIVRFLVKILGPHFRDVFKFMGEAVVIAVGIISDVIKGLIKALGGLVEFIAGVFTGDFKRAWNGIKTFFEGIGDALVGIFKGAINLIINAMNLMVRSLNKIKFDVPDWVPVIGGKNFGFNIPEIPKLAKGGLVTAPTLAMVGDNPGANVDPEVVSPLSKLQELMGGSNQDVVAALMTIIDILQRLLDKDSSIQIGETEFGRMAIKTINNVQRQAGKTLLEL